MGTNATPTTTSSMPMQDASNMPLQDSLDLPTPGTVEVASHQIPAAPPQDAVDAPPTDAPGAAPPDDSPTATQGAGHLAPPPLPQRDPNHRMSVALGEDASSPIHYTRDPHKLTAYLVPFPKPSLGKAAGDAATTAVPDRFMIYTPPPPPLVAPAADQKEDRVHKLQRKWQTEVRDAQTSSAKVTSWKGLKGRATKGINWAMTQTTNSSIDFLTRVPDGKPLDGHGHADASHDDDDADETNATVGLSEMILVHPPLPVSEAELRTEFVNTMLRSQSQAQRDAVIATGLLPVALAADVLATLVWPFGGLVEIDAVWGAASLRGAKTARSVTKRLRSSVPAGQSGERAELKLSFTPSPRLEVLAGYLAAVCHDHDPRRFRTMGLKPTETNVLDAIGWAPSSDGAEDTNWEDEQWQTRQVKEDMQTTFSKAAREWDKWCKAFEDNPEKAMKKGT